MDNSNQQLLPSQQQIEQVPTPSSSSGPSKTFIILVILLILTVSVGAYILGANQNQIVQNQPSSVTPITQPSPTPVDETANWKTYTNSKYNYQIKYRPDWIIEVDGIVVWQNDVPNPELGRQIIFFKSNVHEPNIMILPHPNPKQLSLKEHLIEEILKPIDFPTGDPKAQVSKMKPITIPDVEEALEESNTDAALIIYLRKGSMTIMLALSYGDNPDVSTKTFAKQTFDQILSTFKFTNENQYPRPTRDFSPVIEEEGKLKVQNTPEVQTLITKYGRSNVSIKALDVKLVKDIQFIVQLDPRFKEQTGCIIVVESNSNGYVYQLDKNNEILYRQTLEAFKQKTASADQQVLETFYSSLK